MENFVYNCSTKVIFGRDTEMLVGEEIKSWGGTKVLIHYGSESARRSGLLDRVEKSLQDAGLKYVLLGGVVPNPHIGKVREGIALCKKKMSTSFWLLEEAASSIQQRRSVMALSMRAMSGKSMTKI